jgi:hypothetical protein
MKIPLLLVVAPLGLAIAGCGQKTAKAKTDEDATATGGSALTAPLDYLAAQGKAKQLAVKVTSTAELQSAIQKFYAMEDHYPRDLNELIAQRYLQALPAAPNGMQIAYSPKTGDVKFVPATAPGQAVAPAAQPAPARPAQRYPVPGLKTQPQQQRGAVPE